MCTDGFGAVEWFFKWVFAGDHLVVGSLLHVVIYTIYTWKSVYRVWSDYRVRVYTGFRGGVYRVQILKLEDFESKIISKCSRIKGNPSQNV